MPLFSPSQGHAYKTSPSSIALQPRAAKTISPDNLRLRQSYQSPAQLTNDHTTFFEEGPRTTQYGNPIAGVEFDGNHPMMHGAEMSDR
jgi:hypothetical protein